MKTFAAAMIAFYIALSVDLERPYWSIATVYIVSQPLSDALRSKGLYRMAGTLVGATAAIVLVPNLVDAPLLLSAALALWLGVCLYFSLCDRSPRSYVFMLAGYTAAIIGFPSVDQPGRIFETAGARMSEIVLGIACATLIGSIVFPRSVAPVLQQRLDASFDAARRWAMAALARRPDGEAVARDARRTIAGATTEVRTLTAHLAFDASDRQPTAHLFALLGDRVIYLLPVLSGVAHRVASLRNAGGVPADLQALIDRLAAWLQSWPALSHETGQQLRQALADLAPTGSTPADGSTILRAGLLARLAELVDATQDIAALRHQALAGHAGLPPLALPPQSAPDATRSRDHGMAALSGISAALAIALLCTFWIATAWPDGAIAAVMAAIFSSFFATLDDPVPEILRSLRDIAVGGVIAAFYLFVVLTQIEGFAMVALVLAPFYLMLGAMIAVPATFLRSLSIALNTTMMMTLTDAYSADFADFLNTSMASGFGIATAAGVTALVRSVGTGVGVRRLQRACRRDVARAASHEGAVPRSTLVALLLDRLADLTPRLAAADADGGMQRALNDVGVGLSIVDLQRDCASLPRTARDSVHETLAEVGAYYVQQAPASPAPALLARLDGTLGLVAASGAAAVQSLLTELLSIRHGLFPDAPAPAGPFGTPVR